MSLTRSRETKEKKKKLVGILFTKIFLSKSKKEKGRTWIAASTASLSLPRPPWPSTWRLCSARRRTGSTCVIFWKIIERGTRSFAFNGGGGSSSSISGDVFDLLSLSLTSFAPCLSLSLSNSHPTHPTKTKQCPFYFKIGACRHGDRCSRAHNKPSISPTVLLHNLWRSPAAEAAAQAAAVAAETGLPPPPPKPLTHDEERRAQEDFEDFYEDVFEELAQHGELEALHVCDNVADHLAGSVYAQFADEDDAAAAMEALQRRFYDGRPIVAEFSPVTDFREATCRQYEERNCARGG